jgi:UDP-glucose 4-epimerase
MSRYLVTGGAGFIGSHLCDRLLAEGHSVRVLDDLSTGKRKNLASAVELLVASVTDRDAVNEAFEGCDGAFHLAAVASVARCNNDWAGAHAINITGTIHVFEAAVAQGRKPVVYASSAAVFGGATDLPLTERSPTVPLSAYGADKLACELHGRAGHVVHGLSSTGLRFFNVYGPRQDPSSPYSGVISIFADRLAAGDGITIFGDGQQTRDFVNVVDVVEALYRSMTTSAGAARVFNVCTGRQNSLLDLATALGRILEIEPRIAFAEARAGDIKHSLGDPAALESAVGFRPAIELEDGLRAMLGR